MGDVPVLTPRTRKSRRQGSSQFFSFSLVLFGGGLTFGGFGVGCPPVLIHCLDADLSVGSLLLWFDLLSVWSTSSQALAQDRCQGPGARKTAFSLPTSASSTTSQSSNRDDSPPSNHDRPSSNNQSAVQAIGAVTTSCQLPLVQSSKIHQPNADGHHTSPQWSSTIERATMPRMLRTCSSIARQ